MTGGVDGATYDIGKSLKSLVINTKLGKPWKHGAQESEPAGSEAAFLASPAPIVFIT
jgi:hypothetical protein